MQSETKEHHISQSECIVWYITKYKCTFVRQPKPAHCINSPGLLGSSQSEFAQLLSSIIASLTWTWCLITCLGRRLVYSGAFSLVGADGAESWLIGVMAVKLLLHDGRMGVLSSNCCSAGVRGCSPKRSSPYPFSSCSSSRLLEWLENKGVENWIDDSVSGSDGDCSLSTGLGFDMNGEVLLGLFAISELSMAVLIVWIRMSDTKLCYLMSHVRWRYPRAMSVRDFDTDHHFHFRTLRFGLIKLLHARSFVSS